MMMIRNQIYLSERQVGLLKCESKKYEIKISELIRRILDAHFEKEQDNGEKTHITQEHWSGIPPIYTPNCLQYILILGYFGCYNLPYSVRMYPLLQDNQERKPSETAKDLYGISKIRLWLKLVLCRFNRVNPFRSTLPINIPGNHRKYFHINITNTAREESFEIKWQEK